LTDALKESIISKLGALGGRHAEKLDRLFDAMADALIQMHSGHTLFSVKNGGILEWATFDETIAQAQGDTREVIRQLIESGHIALRNRTFKKADFDTQVGDSGDTLDKLIKAGVVVTVGQEGGNNIYAISSSLGEAKGLAKAKETISNDKKKFNKVESVLKGRQLDANEVNSILADPIKYRDLEGQLTRGEAQIEAVPGKEKLPLPDIKAKERIERMINESSKRAANVIHPYDIQALGRIQLERTHTDADNYNAYSRVLLPLLSCVHGQRLEYATFQDGRMTGLTDTGLFAWVNQALAGKSVSVSGAEAIDYFIDGKAGLVGWTGSPGDTAAMMQMLNAMLMPVGRTANVYDFKRSLQFTEARMTEDVIREQVKQNVLDRLNGKGKNLLVINTVDFFRLLRSRGPDRLEQIMKEGIREAYGESEGHSIDDERLAGLLKAHYDVRIFDRDVENSFGILQKDVAEEFTGDVKGGKQVQLGDLKMRIVLTSIREGVDIKVGKVGQVDGRLGDIENDYIKGYDGRQVYIGCAGESSLLQIMARIHAYGTDAFAQMRTPGDFVQVIAPHTDARLTSSQRNNFERIIKANEAVRGLSGDTRLTSVEQAALREILQGKPLNQMSEVHVNAIEALKGKLDEKGDRILTDDQVAAIDMMTKGSWDVVRALMVERSKEARQQGMMQIARQTEGTSMEHQSSISELVEANAHENYAQLVQGQAEHERQEQKKKQASLPSSGQSAWTPSPTTPAGAMPGSPAGPSATTAGAAATGAMGAGATAGTAGAAATGAMGAGAAAGTAHSAPSILTMAELMQHKTADQIILPRSDGGMTILNKNQNENAVMKKHSVYAIVAGATPIQMGTGVLNPGEVLVQDTHLVYNAQGWREWKENRKPVAAITEEYVRRFEATGQAATMEKKLVRTELNFTDEIRYDMGNLKMVVAVADGVGGYRYLTAEIPHQLDKAYGSRSIFKLEKPVELK
ncbi:MAG: hypothetical protein HQL13_05610, partial [Candidatus Omnitrophica bacterium]|nr:hypothetical protein [Candidatus Omnitrophota bacterium]